MYLRITNAASPYFCDMLIFKDDKFLRMRHFTH
jgi:hypothetical protein